MTLMSLMIPVAHRRRLNFIFTCKLLSVAACVSMTFMVKSNASAQPKVGVSAPQFNLKDQAGTAHSLSQYKGKVVVLEWTNPTCPFVVKHYERDTMTQLAAVHPGVVWLTINSSHYTTDAKNKVWAQREGVRYVLNDASGEVGRRYGAKTTPQMFVINAEGVLVYQGAIDDNPYFDDRKSVNYVAEALKDLAAKRPVQKAETRPYGCSVKYQR